MKKLIIFFCFISVFNCFSQTEVQDKKAIQKVLNTQRIAWSNNNIKKFMKGYWKSDSLKFYGSNGITYGWKNTLEQYLKSYPTKAYTGTLNFKINDISKINDGAYYVLGEFHLKREVGNADGIFMLVFKKINGKWKIIADTSC